MTLLAKRYASALFTLAKDKGAVDAVASDLAALHGELHAPGAAALLDSPDVAADERTRILGKLTEEEFEQHRAKMADLEVGQVADTVFPSAGVRILQARIEDDRDVDMIAISVDESDLLSEIDRLRAALREAGIDPDAG